MNIKPKTFQGRSEAVAHFFILFGPWLLFLQVQNRKVENICLFMLARIMVVLIIEIFHEPGIISVRVNQ